MVAIIPTTVPGEIYIKYCCQSPPSDDKLTIIGATYGEYCCIMMPQPPIDDKLTIIGINEGGRQYIDHNRAQWWGGGTKLTKIGMRSGGGGPRLTHIDHNRDPLCLDDPLPDFNRGHTNET